MHISNIRTFRVLFVSIPSFSHFNGLIFIAQELAEYHRNISISFAIFNEYESAIREHVPSSNLVFLGPLSKNNTKFDFCVKDHESPLQFISRVSLPSFLAVYETMHTGLLNANIAVNFDLLIINMFAFAAQDLAYDLNIPFVIHSCMSVDGVLSLPSWIPRGFDDRTQDDLQSSLFARLDNYLIEPFRIGFHMGTHMLKLERLRLHAKRSTQGFQLLLGNRVQRWQGHPILFPYPLALDFPRAYTPNHHFLGFVLDEKGSGEATNEDEEIETWLNEKHNSDEFVLLVALGSVSILNGRVWSAIIHSLTLLPNMRIFLAIRDEISRNFVLDLASKIDSRRVLIRSWIPQRRVLANPQVRVFLCHGGLYSIGEAVHAHKPIIILPGFGDQKANGARLRAWNISVVLQRHSLTDKILAEAIKSIMHKDQYIAIVERLKHLHYLSEMEGGGARRAAQLIEGWARYGYSHLDTLDHHLPFWTVYDWDIYIFILSFLFVIWKILRFLFFK